MLTARVAGASGNNVTVATSISTGAEITAVAPKGQSLGRRERGVGGAGHPGDRSSEPTSATRPRPLQRTPITYYSGRGAGLLQRRAIAADLRFTHPDQRPDSVQFRVQQYRHGQRLGADSAQRWQHCGDEHGSGFDRPRQPWNFRERRAGTARGGGLPFIQLRDRRHLRGWHD